MRRVYWLGWDHYRHLPINMFKADGSRRTPTINAYSRVVRWMRGYTHQGCTVTKGLYTCTLTGTTSGRAETRIVKWRTWGTSTAKTPARTFKVETGTGYVRSVGANKPYKITSVPVMIRTRR